MWPTMQHHQQLDVAIGHAVLIQIPLAVTELEPPVGVKTRHSTVPIGFETTSTQTQQRRQDPGHVDGELPRIVTRLDSRERGLKCVQVCRIGLSQDARASAAHGQFGHCSAHDDKQHRGLDVFAGSNGKPLVGSSQKEVEPDRRRHRSDQTGDAMSVCGHGNDRGHQDQGGIRVREALAEWHQGRTHGQRKQQTYQNSDSIAPGPPGPPREGHPSTLRCPLARSKNPNGILTRGPGPAGRSGVAGPWPVPRGSGAMTADRRIDRLGSALRDGPGHITHGTVGSPTLLHRLGG